MLTDERIKDALDKGIIGEEEFGFINSLISRFKTDILRKEKIVNQTLGEINQLRVNLDIIKEMAINMIAAQERAEARIETANKLRTDREVSKLSKITKSNKDKKEIKDEVV